MIIKLIGGGTHLRGTHITNLSHFIKSERGMLCKLIATASSERGC